MRLKGVDQLTSRWVDELNGRWGGWLKVITFVFSTKLQ